MAEDRRWSDEEIEKVLSIRTEDFPIYIGIGMLHQLLADRKRLEDERDAALAKAAIQKGIRQHLDGVIARLEGRLCLVCGKDAPCDLDKSDMSPCTFDPSPVEAAQRFLRRAETAEREIASLRAQIAELESKR